MEINKIISILLKNSKIFKEFNNDEIVEILKMCKSRVYKASEVILLKG